MAILIFLKLRLLILMSLMIHTDIPSSLETDRIITMSVRPAWATEGDLASKAFFF